MLPHQANARTQCGFATIHNVLTMEKEDRMESFFLAETLKYLFLLFDDANVIHRPGQCGNKQVRR